ncbi:PAS domain-containing protein, partial [Trichostrongylus colubriformis]
MMDQRQVIFREIDNLKQALPVSKAILEQQVLLRVASTYLAIRNYFGQQILFSKDIIETTSLILQALDGFCFILDDRYHILYITESVSTHLGFSQVYMYMLRLLQQDKV